MFMPFKGLTKNGVLVVDSAEALQEQLVKSLGNLPDRYGQQLQIYFAELLKNKRKRIIKVDAGSVRGDMGAIMARLNELYSVDAVCVSHDALHISTEVPPNAVPVAEYSESEVEQRREKYLSELPPLHQLSLEEVRDCFGRAVRYSKWLRFYDKQIGKGTNLHNFFRGIDFILGIWQEYGVFSQERSRIEIITSTMHYIEDNTYNREGKLDENRRAVGRVIEQLVKKLQAKYPHWEIALRVKNVSPKLFHARYLEAQFLILSVDRGFDFLDRDGKRCLECSLNIRNGDAANCGLCLTFLSINADLAKEPCSSQSPSQGRNT